MHVQETDSAPRIRLANSEAERIGCYATLRELRPHLDPPAFLAALERMQAQGFRLAYTESPAFACVAGFRLMEMLATGPVLYVDDLATAAEQRSLGLGRAMLNWLFEYAREAGCRYLELDSGSARSEAHRFYRRFGLEPVAQHFSMPVTAGAAWSEQHSG